MGVRSICSIRSRRMEQDTVTISGTDTTDVEAAAGDELVADELLIEEISIDGMCGVY